MSDRGRSSLVRGALALALCFLATRTVAAADDTEVRGRVESSTSRWTTGRDTIVTDVVVRTADGRQVILTTPGGTVDGIGMSYSHHDDKLVTDDEVVLVTKRNGVRAQRVGATRVTSGSASATASRVGVQRTTRSQRALYHPTGCLEFVYDGDGTTKLAAEWDAVDSAFNAWEDSSEDLSCGGSVRFSRRVMPHAPDGRDGINTIHFRDDTWCRPATLGEAEVCHNPDAVAVTRMIFVDDPVSPRDGEIIEVDIEINTVDFALATDGRATAIDLTSAVAHEIGHALGLDHNCGIEGTAWPVGSDGTPVESCESASADLVAATMYFQVAPGTTAMRTPEAADTEGVCEVVTETCATVVSGGCSADGDGNAPPLVIAGLFAGLFAKRRRHRIHRID